MRVSPRSCHRIAARLLCPQGRANAAALHPELFDALSRVDDLCQRQMGHLSDGNTIALIVFYFMEQFPDKVPYKER